MSEAKKSYSNPYTINSHVWFYKNKNSFEFVVTQSGVEARIFRVQDRTLLSFITGKAKDKRR